jgi:hypothetical protein
MILAIAGAVAAVAAVCVSISLNPPSAVKAQALDQQRLQGMQQMDFAIKAYYRTHQALPDRIGSLENSGLMDRSNWKDPITHQPYEYDLAGKTSYRLCADFSADSEPDDHPYGTGFRQHHKGHDCFQVDVNGD